MMEGGLVPPAPGCIVSPGLGADPVDDTFPDDATSGEPDAYVGSQGPVLNGFPSRELEPSKEGVVDPGGMREKRVMITPHATRSCSQKSRTPRPHPPLAPSRLGAVVDSTLQTRRGAVFLQKSGEEGLADRQLGTLAFQDRLAAVGVGTPAVAFRRSTGASAPPVRLRPLADNVAHAVRAPPVAPAPRFRTASASSLFGSKI